MSSKLLTQQASPSSGASKRTICRWITTKCLAPWDITIVWTSCEKFKARDIVTSKLPLRIQLNSKLIEIIFQQILEKSERTEKHQKHFASPSVDGQLKPTAINCADTSTDKQQRCRPSSIRLSKPFATKYKSSSADSSVGAEQQDGIQQKQNRRWANRLEHFKRRCVREKIHQKWSRLLPVSSLKPLSCRIRSNRNFVDWSEVPMGWPPSSSYANTRKAYHSI